jgi:hypothetical protein
MHWSCSRRSQADQSSSGRVAAGVVTSIPISLAALEHAIRGEWCADTAWAAKHWSAERPAAGQCFSTAYVVKSIFGGEVVHAEVLPHTEPKQRHSWNRLPSGLELDLTREQFPHGQQFAQCDLPEELVWEHGGKQAQLLLQRVLSRLAFAAPMVAGANAW